jgi:hypothetical protein
MKCGILILLIISFKVCDAQNPAKEDRYTQNHGIWLDKADTSLKKYIRIVHFAHSTGVIFPAQYGKEKFGYTDRFTPDTDLIKSIDNEIITQMCNAVAHLNEKNLDDLISRTDDKKEIRALKKRKALIRTKTSASCEKWQAQLIYYDKQYWGFITADGRRTIQINLLDFRDDPYNLKPALYTSWIEGWHGWFETNHLTAIFHLDNHLLTINFD